MLGRALLAACRCDLICQAGGAVAAVAAAAPRSECVWSVYSVCLCVDKNIDICDSE